LLGLSATPIGEKKTRRKPLEQQWNPKRKWKKLTTNFLAPSRTWADETQAVRVGVDGDGGFSMAKASPQFVAFSFVEKGHHFETTRTKKHRKI
jgi:hypothetical protein